MSVEKDEDPHEVVEEHEEDVREEFKCKYCEFEATNIDDLDDHIITHDEVFFEDHFDENEANNIAGNDGIAGDHSTTTRSKKSKRKQPQFSVNTKKRITDFADSDNATSKTIFVCPYCSLQTGKKNDMTIHLQEHVSPVELPIYACSECPYATRRKCDMPKHLLTHCKDGNVPMYRCPHCTYATKRKGDLPKHLLCHKKPHVDELFSCDQCPYASKRKGDLRKHIQSHATDALSVKNGSVYNCTECGYTSKRLNDLHKHAVLHCDKLVTGILKCQKCDYASEISNHFARHVLSNCQLQERPPPPPPTVALPTSQRIVFIKGEKVFLDITDTGEVDDDEADVEEPAAILDAEDEEVAILNTEI